MDAEQERRRVDPDQERWRELQDERVREWQTRRRGPGDLVTWAVVLGGVMAVFIFFSAAYDGSTVIGGAIAIAIIAWTLVVWVPGGVNVLSVFWGRASNPVISPEQTRIVLLASAVLSALAIFMPVLDLASSFDFGWYGIIAAAVGIMTLILIARSGQLRA